MVKNLRKLKLFCYYTLYMIYASVNKKIFISYFNKKAKVQLEVRFKFIQVFTSVNIEKVFFIQEFLSSYPSVISNQRKNNIKKYFIKLVHLFKEQDLIEDNYKIISNGHYYFTKEFNTHDISEGFVIYEKLSI